MVVTHFGLVDVVEKQLYIIPRVMMASDDAVLARLFFYDNPEYKRHPNYTKTDQLPISEVITGLPRPYHHTSDRTVKISKYPMSNFPKYPNIQISK